MGPIQSRMGDSPVNERVLDLLTEANENAITADGYEDALIGVGHRFGGAIAVYDLNKCIGILMERDGMTEEEAREFFDFNTLGAYAGPFTPIFLETVP